MANGFVLLGFSDDSAGSHRPRYIVRLLSQATPLSFAQIGGH